MSQTREDHFRNLVERVHGTPAEYLWVANAPLSLGGVPERKSIEEVEVLFGFKYTESIFMPSNIAGMRFDPHDELAFIWEALQERLEHPLSDSLVICKINDEVGYGVFARNFIPAGTMIGLYAGVLEVKTPAMNAYGFDLTGEAHLRSNADKVGGITRFVQHMPFSLNAIARAIREKSSNLKDLLVILDANGIFFDDSDVEKIAEIIKEGPEATADFINYQVSVLAARYKEQMRECEMNSHLDNISDLATMNIQALPLSFDNKKFTYFQACCDIIPGEQLGVTYGHSYWEMRQQEPKYFNRRGQIIEPVIKTILRFIKSQTKHEIEETLQKIVPQAAWKISVKDAVAWLKVESENSAARVVQHIADHSDGVNAAKEITKKGEFLVMIRELDIQKLEGVPPIELTGSAASKLC